MMLRVSDAGLGTVQSGVCSAEQCCFSPIFLCCVPMIPLWNKVTLCYCILKIYNFFKRFLSFYFGYGCDAYTQVCVPHARSAHGGPEYSTGYRQLFVLQVLANRTISVVSLQRGR